MLQRESAVHVTLHVRNFGVSVSVSDLSLTGSGRVPLPMSGRAWNRSIESSEGYTTASYDSPNNVEA